MSTLQQPRSKTASPSAPILAAIFDMDGLMLDSERLALDCWKEAAGRLGAPLHEEAILGMVGMHSSKTQAWLTERFGPDYPSEHIHSLCHEIYLERSHAAPIPLKTGVLELLEWLETNHVPKAVATSTRRHIALHHLEHAGLLKRFQFIVCGDEISHPKPAPDIYLAALTKLGIAADNCIVLEDSDFGVQAAHAAGCRVIMVPDIKTPTSETRKLGIPIVESLHDALELLEKSGDIN
ncbi:haloacid dehalogenase superfamily, subfamily IA, variant 3 with third motif having DD or ED [Formivibrio citricus]|uniref:Haloacid dehalogenase superfamily, subfamily IA, variant 3 with third motif having DD or ED n=1 Tax=Formivibrio citricus TaxID=83765 RepID=A0A1I5B7J9_9NEIS|nr:HAD family phosphatase [Formivibrio citricus]SFN70676.1 haloacid dehalogenase superfamily, subfamily IA, variant 3 with third motif having DD or ED [Formivibrio citricus]